MPVQWMDTFWAGPTDILQLNNQSILMLIHAQEDITMTISNNGPGKEVQEGKSKLKYSFLRVYHAVSLV